MVVSPTRLEPSAIAATPLASPMRKSKACYKKFIHIQFRVVRCYTLSMGHWGNRYWTVAAGPVGIIVPAVSVSAGDQQDAGLVSSHDIIMFGTRTDGTVSTGVIHVVSSCDTRSVFSWIVALLIPNTVIKNVNGIIESDTFCVPR